MKLGRLGSGTLLVASAIGIAGCWEVWNIEPLTNEGAGGTGAGGTGAGGTGAGGAGAGGAGAGGAGAGGGESGPCKKAPDGIVDGPFQFLATCDGMSAYRVSASSQGLALSAERAMPKESVVVTFDLDGTPRGWLRLPNVDKPVLSTYSMDDGATVRVALAGSFLTGNTTDVLGDQSPVCDAAVCSFITILNEDLSVAVSPPQWVDPGGSTGGFRIQGIDAQRIGYLNQHWLALTGGLRGSAQLFDASAPMQANGVTHPFFVAAKVDSDTPASATQRLFDTTTNARALECALSRTSAMPLRAFAVGDLPDDGVGAWFDVLTPTSAPVFEHATPGEATDVTRANAFGFLVEDAGEVAVHVFTPPGPSPVKSYPPMQLPSARITGHENDLYVGGGFSGTLTVDGTSRESKGLRDLILVHVDSNTDVMTPHVLGSDSADDAFIADVDALANDTKRVYFVATFTGSMKIGGYTANAAPEGSVLVGSFTLP